MTTVMIHPYDHLPVGPIKLFRLIDLYILDHRQLFEFFCLPFSCLVLFHVYLVIKVNSCKIWEYWYPYLQQLLFPFCFSAALGLDN